MIRKKVKVSSLGQMEENMMVPGKMENNMVWQNNVLKNKVLYTKLNGIKEEDLPKLKEMKNLSVKKMKRKIKIIFLKTVKKVIDSIL